MIQNAKKRLLPLEGKILLGLSGGPDSMCLCALLRECNKKFHIAHIDHGLQEGSHLERERIALYAQAHDIPFHFITLEKGEIPGKNLEEALRDKRIAFFKKTMDEEGLDLLLLGHQKDERAETMLKRFFEGGSLFNLPGMKKEVEYEGMRVFRPLLNTTKKEVVEYLEKKGVKYFVDPTNFGDGNLRAKMRSSLLPILEKEFGKNIVSSVCDLGDQVEEVAKYIDREILKGEKIAIPGIMGVYYPYCERLDDFVFTKLIHKVLKDRRITLSRDQRQVLKEGVSKRVIHKNIPCGDFILFLEEGGVFLIEKKLYRPFYGTLNEGVSWLAFWKEGKGLTSLSEVKYHAYLDKGQISDEQRKAKMPICLRKVFPIPLTAIRKSTKIAHVT